VQLGGDVLPALAVFVPMLIALYGFGFAFAALVLLMRDAMTLIDTASYLVMLLSGAQFPVQALPRALLPLSLALPLTYGLDLVRASLLGTGTLLPPVVEVAILVVAMVLAAPAGYWVFARVERRCRRLGTLGLH
jgi:ABC-2 type transport system permease protein